MSSAETPAVEAARAKGLVVVWPGPDELFVDIDDADSLATFDRHAQILNSVVSCTWEIHESPSSKPFHAHATVRLSRPVESPMERILLQALLGSDLLHEILSWKQATAGNPNPTCFFEKPKPKPELGSATELEVTF